MQVDFNWIGGATCVLSLGDLKFAIDPVLCKKGAVHDYFWFKSNRLKDPIYNESTFNDIDFWLITHNHEDHLDKEGLSVIASSTYIISNANASKVLANDGKQNIKVLKWRQKHIFQNKGYHIAVEAIKAIHGVNPLSAILAGKVNGYYMKISKGNDSVALYFTSDTVYKKSIIKQLKNKSIDLMIPNMGAAKQGSWIMTLTLNAKMLKQMIAKLNPKKVIPVHFGTFKHYVEPIDMIISMHDDKIDVINVGQTKTFEF